jgi:hypothetical protein
MTAAFACTGSARRRDFTVSCRQGATGPVWGERASGTLKAPNSKEASRPPPLSTLPSGPDRRPRCPASTRAARHKAQRYLSVAKSCANRGRQELLDDPLRRKSKLRAVPDPCAGGRVHRLALGRSHLRRNAEPLDRPAAADMDPAPAAVVTANGSGGCARPCLIEQLREPPRPFGRRAPIHPPFFLRTLDLDGPKLDDRLHVPDRRVLGVRAPRSGRGASDPCRAGRRRACSRWPPPVRRCRSARRPRPAAPRGRTRDQAAGQRSGRWLTPLMKFDVRRCTGPSSATGGRRSRSSAKKTSI